MNRRLAQEPVLLKDVLEFLDDCSLIRVRQASRVTKGLVEQEICRNNFPNLEIVQMKEEDGNMMCRCLARSGKALSYTASSLGDAAKWLAPLVKNANIRLFTFVKVELCERTALNLAVSLPASIDQLSMIGVSLLYISPTSFNHLLCAPLRAKKYAFTGMKDVSGGHFNGALLKSEAFMKGEVVDINVLNLQQLTAPCISVCEKAVLTWFFEGPVGQRRSFLSNRLSLGPYMVEQMINRFLLEKFPRPSQMVLCGQVEQHIEPYRNFVTSIRGRQAITIENKETDEELVVIMLQTDCKMEISRHPIAKFKSRGLRPVGQALLIHMEPIIEGFQLVDNINIGYERFGHGPNYLLGICGAVEIRIYALELTPFCVMGWSEGARTAVHVATQGKDIVTRLVLMAASTRADEKGDQGFQGIRNTDHWMPNMREKYLPFCDEDFLRVQWASLCDVIHEVYQNYGGRFPSDLVLHKVTQPTLLMYGGTDKFIMDQKYFKTKIKNLREAVHTTGGHDFYVQYPRWFALRVSMFLTEA